MRFGKYRSNEKILHDEYFGDQPSAAFLLTARLVLLCLMSASFVMIFCDVYGYAGNGFIPAGIAAAASGAIYILTSVFPAPIIYGAVTAALAGVMWVLRDKVILLSTYLWDYFMVKLDSRLLHTAEFMIHTPSRIINASPAETEIMTKAYFWAAMLLGVLCSLLFTAAVRTRFHFSVPAIAVTVITAPAVAAEIAAFVPSYIAFVVCVFGFEAIRSSYDLDCGFIYGSVTSARLALLRADHDYRRRTRAFILGKRIKSDTERYHRYSGNMIAMTCITAMVFFGVTYFIPEGTGLNYQKVMDAISDFGNEAANTIGDIFGITFGKADDRGYFSSDSFGEVSGSISLQPPSDSDRPVLEVKLSRNDIPVYLRGDIGVEYRNNSWTSVSAAADKYNELVGADFYPEAEYQVFRRYIAWKNEGADPDAIMPLQMVSLKYMRNTRVVFQPVSPYELCYKDSDIYDYFGDYILRTKKGFIKTIDGFALTPYISDPAFNEEKAAEILYSIGNEELALNRRYISVPDMTNERYLEQLAAYRGFIESTYMKHSENSEASENYPVISGLMQDFLDYYAENGYYTKEKADYGTLTNVQRYYQALALCRYFSENYTYSLSADNGEDMLDSFLNDTHNGHCALFATAMTLALRELGVPARYVTGYVAYPGGEQDADGNYRQILTERQLHAWTEVYFRGIGWLPFDPTTDVPGYGEAVPENSGETTAESTTSASGTTDEPDTTEPPETEPSDSDTTAPADTAQTEPSSSDAPAEHRENGDDLWLRLLPLIVIMLVIIALAIVAVLFFRNLSASEKRTIKSFRTLPPTEATSLMYRFTMVLLETKGLVPGNEQFYDFAERVDGSIELKGLNYFLMDVMPIFEKAEFGDPKTSPVSEDERDAVYRYTAAVYAKVMSDASSLKRFSMKISLFL